MKYYIIDSDANTENVSNMLSVYLISKFLQLQSQNLCMLYPFNMNLIAKELDKLLEQIEDTKLKLKFYARLSFKDYCYFVEDEKTQKFINHHLKLTANDFCRNSNFNYYEKRKIDKKRKRFIYEVCLTEYKLGYKEKNAQLYAIGDFYSKKLYLTDTFYVNYLLIFSRTMNKLVNVSKY